MAETLRKYGAKYNTTYCELCGLSTDTKPIREFDGVNIANGSKFIEIDTDKEFRYDAENEEWNEVESGGSGGGGGSVRLIPKSVGANGIYKASDDNADGYRKVTVDVPKEASLTDAIRFFDYDGTLVKSYTAAEFANLTEMPDNPSHEGLTAQGWNWSLSDAKACVTKLGKLDIGQMYITSDGKTRLYITLTEGRTAPYLKLYLNDDSELDVDWGDGSAHSTYTSTSAEYIIQQHNYSEAGDYVIAITVVSGSFALKSSQSQLSTILSDLQNTTSSTDATYINAIKKIEVGNSVTSIGSSAFRYCYSLSTITLPSSLTEIEGYSFGNTSLASITIPSSVTGIGNYTFSSCYLLSSISLPKSITSIGQYAFYYCTSLTSITIPDSITSIGQYAFQYCYSLSSIIIPDSITSIGNYAFQYCRSLSSDIILNGATGMGTNVFSGCSALSEITIPSSMTTVPYNTFQNCNSLTSIILSEGVTTIAISAFNDCHVLTSIIIPNSVTSIGSSAFSNCYSLSKITIQNTEGAISGAPWGASSSTQIVWTG